MLKTLTVKIGQKPTEEQIKEIREAANSPIVYDEDCPPMSPGMLKAFRCVAERRNRMRKA